MIVNMFPALVLVLVLASLLPVAVPVFLPNAGDFVKAGYKQVAFLILITYIHFVKKVLDAELSV